MSNFPVDFFCLKLLKHFVGEPFNVSLFSCIEKGLHLRGLCHDFLSKFFSLMVTKKIVEEQFCVSQNLWYRKVLWIGDG